MARYLGADLVGVTRLADDDTGHPFAIVCAVRADDDPRQARGIGGQIPVQNGLFVTFVLSAWIRELGFRATAAPSLDGTRLDGDWLAAAAELGTLDRTGKLLTAEFGTRVHIAVGRMDGAAPLTAELAVNKAYTAAAFHLSTADVAAQARQPWLKSLLVAHRGRLLAAAGGLVLFDGIAIIGAIGVAGGNTPEHDVLCCQAAFAILEAGRQP